jgi:hypothetical protein
MSGGKSFVRGQGGGERFHYGIFVSQRGESIGPTEQIKIEKSRLDLFGGKRVERPIGV